MPCLLPRSKSNGIPRSIESNIARSEQWITDNGSIHSNRSTNNRHYTSTICSLTKNDCILVEIDRLCTKGESDGWWSGARDYPIEDSILRNGLDVEFSEEGLSSSCIGVQEDQCCSGWEQGETCSASEVRSKDDRRRPLSLNYSPTVDDSIDRDTRDFTRYYPIRLSRDWNIGNSPRVLCRIKTT